MAQDKSKDLLQMPDFQHMGRRDFISNVTKTTAGLALLSLPSMATAKIPYDGNPVTVGEIIDRFIRQVPRSPLPGTVDTLKSGSRDIKVTGIVTTMFATIEVIRKTIQLGANFIIVHEPTFYNHEDKTDWLQQDDVYNYKMNLLRENKIAVWRNHDYIHSLATDGVRSGVVAQLGWQSYTKDLKFFTMPTITLQELIQHVKSKLGIQQLRYIGDQQQACSKVLLSPGAAGGTEHITGISSQQPDVFICGEVHEWETAEYVRDARAKGKNIALIVLGHIASEEPGSEFMARWVKDNVPGVTVTHVPAGNSLSFA